MLVEKHMEHSRTYSSEEKNKLSQSADKQIDSVHTKIINITKENGAKRWSPNKKSTINKEQGTGKTTHSIKMRSRKGVRILSKTVTGKICILSVVTIKWTS